MGQRIILDYNAVLELKKTAAQHFADAIHFHDGCGGQYFSLDSANDMLKNYIVQYYSNRNMRAVFSEDGLHFTVEKGTTC